MEFEDAYAAAPRSDGAAGIAAGGVTLASALDDGLCPACGKKWSPAHRTVVVEVEVKEV